jgi:hypothetical protein
MFDLHVYIECTIRRLFLHATPFVLFIMRCDDYAILKRFLLVVKKGLCHRPCFSQVVVLIICQKADIPSMIVSQNFSFRLIWQAKR